MLLVLSKAVLERFGWAVVLFACTLILLCLELLYRRTRPFLAKNKRKWWAKPRHGVSMAQGKLTVLILVAFAALMIRSELARYWLIATVIGTGLVVLGLQFQQKREDGK